MAFLIMRFHNIFSMRHSFLPPCLVSVILMAGCASLSYDPEDPTYWEKKAQEMGDIDICKWLYTDRYWGIARSMEYRIGVLGEFEKERQRRNFVCSERFPSWEEFRGKTRLEQLSDENQSS